ncbi:NAD(P)/FAD-dependent oxidoreductase [Kribbella deserti]|uniref:NADH:ubiquinone reductase (non-electrogenic) n=1 Tax=Kribbella deserti TaxID=1926257 RepID=A0ABV6QS82_9ACTN
MSSESQYDGPPRRPRVVVVGGGFGGLQAVRGLRRANADVILVDRTNHHLFQPLLYQVSTALLSPGDIAPALRKVLAGQRNAEVLLAEVSAIEPTTRALTVTTADGNERQLNYDYLVLAAGSTQSYFGHGEWAQLAPSMKTLDEAVELRSRLFRAFEIADATDDPEIRRRALTFVVVGAGPTGVELAGQLSALARRTLSGQYRRFEPSDLRIVLVDAADKVLAPFAEPLREHTRRKLEDLGVEVLLGHPATGVDRTGITLGGHWGVTHINAGSIVWAAGVQPAPIIKRFAETTGTPTDRQGRIQVADDCTVPGVPDVFVIGDAANLHDLPGIAEPAMQEGKYVAKVIRHRLGERKAPKPFRYLDLGTMATISPLDAVAQIGRIKLRGPIGKAAWAGVHLAFLVGWGNRLAVLGSWAAVLSRGARRQQVVLGDASQADPRAERPRAEGARAEGVRVADVRDGRRLQDNRHRR